MLARFKPRKVIACFALAGVLAAVPLCARLLLAAGGLLSFPLSPMMGLWILKGGDLNWKFFALAAPLNALLYGAYGRLMVYLSKGL